MKVCEGRISSHFGNRTHPISGEKDKFHSGVDIAAPVGTPVYSPINGVVTLVDTGPVGGKQIHVTNEVIMSPTEKFRVDYHFLHLSEWLVKRGDKVIRGQKIGKVGATGQVTGPHLHFGMKIDGTYINSEPFI